MRNYAIINILSFIAVVTMNALSNSLPLNGKTPGELSDQYPNLFVPAGFTFSIWGIIYLLLLIWVVAQSIALFNQRLRRAIAPGVNRVGWLFAISCTLNIGWLFAWHWQYIALAVLIMIGLLACLVMLNTRTQADRVAANSAEKWLIHPVFSIYQGWITVALIANITALLVAIGWQGWGISESVWTVLMIAAGATVAFYMIYTRNQLFHGLAVIWALFGIYAKRTMLNDGDLVPFAAITAMIALSSLVIGRFWKRRMI